MYTVVESIGGVDVKRLRIGKLHFEPTYRFGDSSKNVSDSNPGLDQTDHFVECGVRIRGYFDDGYMISRLILGLQILTYR